MPLIKPGPGERWCPCCELIFVPAKPAQRLCTRTACLAGRAGRFKGRHYCSDCKHRLPKHEESCRHLALLAIGLPDGPCPNCGGRPLPPRRQ